MTFKSLDLFDIDPDWQASGRWRQGAALGTPGGMVLPVQTIFVHHTVSPDTGDVVADVAGPCDTDQRNFSKVSYSWNVHESTGSVIEVEGTHRGAHTINNAQQSLNGIAFGFGLIGNFHSGQPTPTPRPPSDLLIVLTAEAIVEKAIKPGYAAPDVPIAGHRDAPYATACCGDMLYARLPDIRAEVARLVAQPPTEDDVAKATYVMRDNSPNVYAHFEDGRFLHVSQPNGLGYQTLEDLYATTLGVQFVQDPFPAGYHITKDVDDGTGLKRRVTVLGKGTADALGVPA